MFVINVLLVGGAESFFFSAIVDRLLKEHHTIYHIAGKSISKAASINKRVTTYNIDIDDEYAQFVVRSIVPEAIVYLGAFDDRHVWSDYHRCSAKYMCELTNILVTASDLGVNKFVYLSTLNVYGFKNEGLITEETPTEPQNVKSIIISQGERLCKDFTDQNKISAVILRFGLIYGDLKCDDVNSDYIMNKCLSAIVERKITVNNQVSPLIYVTDAAIAVHKAIYLESDGGIYNVCDDETISDAEICDIILTDYIDKYDITLEGDESFTPQNYKIDGSKFNTDFSFFQKIKYKQGISQVVEYVRNNHYRLTKQLSKKTDVIDEKRDFKFYFKVFWKAALPYIETILAFLIFIGVQYLFEEILHIDGLDFMLLFIIIASITFGKKTALVSVILSVLYYVYPQLSEGVEVLSILISSGFIIRILYLFIIGVIVGHVRDRLHQTIHELEARNEYLESEYKKLYEINDITVAVKQELEERLLTYTDSFAKLYSIIEEIDSLLPLKVYIKGLAIASDILKSPSICIYARSPKNPRLNLIACTDENSKTLGDHIDVRYIGQLQEAFVKGEIFTNRNLEKDLPILAAPLLINGEIEAVIMVWSLKFDLLTMYHINLFVTLAKIMTHSLDKALAYRKTFAEQQKQRNPSIHESGAFLLSEDEFYTAVETAFEGQNYNIPYSIISISTDDIPEKDIFELFKPLLARLVYVQRRDTKIDILLGGIEFNTVQNYINEPEISAYINPEHIQFIRAEDILED